MGLGKITRGLGKVGLAFEALGYVWAAGSALVKAVKGKRSAGNSSNNAEDIDRDVRGQHADEGGNKPG